MLLYRLLISLFSCAALVQAMGLPDGVRMRLGRLRPQSGPHIWLHGASNGELASVRPVIIALARARPDLKWLITSNSFSGMRMVREWDLPGVSAMLAPLDLKWVSRRMMRVWNVEAHISLESEIWPHRFAVCPGPVILLGARLGQGTARAWGRLPGLARQIFGRVSFASAQDTLSLERLGQLGLSAQARGPVFDLKALYTPPDLAPDDRLRRAFPRAQTWLAASTHPGEEDVVLKAHLELLRQAPQSRLILAPRHPQRAGEIARLIERHGLSYSRRSMGGAPDAQVYLADSLGEMALWYTLAGRVFIGGTLCRRGGHTPYEPAAFGCALLHGPDTRNFRASFERLAQSGACALVTNAGELAQALEECKTAQAQQQSGKAATEALRQELALDPFIARIMEYMVFDSQTGTTKL